MKLLITAGNTHAPIDRVRVVTNVFTGRTGATLARTAWTRGHTVTLLTSHPETLGELADTADDPDRRITVVPYQTFDDLTGLMQSHIRSGSYDGLLHTAAVSDYLCAGVYAPEQGTYFNARTNQWERRGGPAELGPRRGGKLSSQEPELWFRMVRAPKLIDRVRSAWGFTGLVVKFKLEVGIGDAELLEIAENSRTHSKADLIVANTLEGSAHYAYVGPVQNRYERVERRELADYLMLALELIQRYQGSRHG